MKRTRKFFQGIFVVVIIGLIAGCGTSGSESGNPPISKTETNTSGQTWTFTASVLLPKVVSGQSGLLSDIRVDVGEKGLSGATTLSVSGLPVGWKWGTISTAPDKYEDSEEVALCEIACGEIVVIQTQIGTPVGNGIRLSN